jgi:hypothetical protein
LPIKLLANSFVNDFIGIKIPPEIRETVDVIVAAVKNKPNFVTVNKIAEITARLKICPSLPLTSVNGSGKQTHAALAKKTSGSWAKAHHFSCF